MIVVLEAVAGPVTGRRIEIRGGTILRLGRTTRADYPLPEDGYLSSLHFAVECDGAQARVRDLGSSNGTFINGSKVVDQVVKEGDSLTAGGSTFTVRIDNSANPSFPSQSSPTMSVPTAVFGATRATLDIKTTGAPALGSQNWPGFSKSQGNLLQTIYSANMPVFALLDASKDSRIPAFLDASGEPFIPVDPTGRVPVFIASPNAQSRLLDVLIKDGWGRGWCSYWIAPVSLHEACAHLAAFLTLYTVHGKPVTFRFWDARILRILVPLMAADEAATFLGPFTRLVVEGDKPEMAIELGLTPRGPRQQAITL